MQPEILVITGDVAFSGKKAEYDAARKWIDERLLPAAGGLSKDRVLVVPGNHDVDRTKVGAAAKALHKVLVDATSQEEVAKVLHSRDDRALMPSPPYVQGEENINTVPVTYPPPVRDPVP